jgi:hypothetical protein
VTPFSLQREAAAEAVAAAEEAVADAATPAEAAAAAVQLAAAEGEVCRRPLPHDSTQVDRQIHTKAIRILTLPLVLSRVA